MSYLHSGPKTVSLRMASTRQHAEETRAVFPQTRPYLGCATIGVIRPASADHTCGRRRLKSWRHYFAGSRFRQRATAALRALSRRSSADRRLARAFPPFCPRAAAWRFFGFVTVADGNTLPLYGITLLDRLTLCVALRILSLVSPSSHDGEHNRPSDAAGLAALVECLRRYVERNPSRFEIVEGAKRNSTIRTFVFGDRGIAN